MLPPLVAAGAAGPWGGQRVSTQREHLLLPDAQPALGIYLSTLIIIGFLRSKCSGSVCEHLDGDDDDCNCSPVI